MSSAAPQSAQIAGAYPEASRGFLWGVGLSIVVHGLIFWLAQWLQVFDLKTEAIVEQEDTKFVPVSLFVKDKKQEQPRNNPDGPEQPLDNRPNARFSNPNALTRKRDEVPKKAPVETFVPGGNRKTIGPGPGAPSFNPGGDSRFVAPNGIKNSASAAAKSIGLGDGNARFFNITDAGKRIVYAVDRSGSMSTSEPLSELQIAKQELIASLNRLTTKHRFLVLFYDDTVMALTINRQNGREIDLLPATPNNIARIKSRIHSVRAKGNTEHMRALRAAMRLRPDAIYFLTDAESALKPRDIDNIRRMNRTQKTRIHCIQFGKGANLRTGNNFLKQLSAVTGGRYRYRNVERSGRR